MLRHAKPPLAQHKACPARTKAIMGQGQNRPHAFLSFCYASYRWRSPSTKPEQPWMEITLFINASPAEGKGILHGRWCFKTWHAPAMKSRPDMFRRSTDTCSRHGLPLQQANVVRFVTAGERKMSSTKGHQLLT